MKVVAVLFVFGLAQICTQAFAESIITGHSAVSSQAVQAINSGDYSGGIKLLEDASSADPFDDGLKALLGKAYTAKGWEEVKAAKFEDALLDFKKAMLAEPQKQADTYLGLGYSLFQLNQTDDALSYLQELEDMEPKSPQAHALLGQIHYQRGQLDEAISEWEQTLALDPKDEAIKAALARANKERGVEGSFTKRETYSFNIKYEGEEKRELGDLVMDMMYKASSDVGGDLGYYPKDAVNVILYTRQQFNDVTNAPDWSGGVYDGNIRVPVGGNKIDNDALSAILHHEYTHAVINLIAGQRVPAWLNEGIAQHEESWAKPRAAQGGFRVVPFKSLESSFVSMDSAKANDAYAESLSAVEFFIKRYGTYSLSKLIKLIGDGKSVSDSMTDAAGVSLDQFEELWRNGLGK